MANLNDPIFTIDAGKILAKLHAAALQATAENCLVINTGIVEPQEKADPEKVKDTTMSFDLKNSLGEYQLGICTRGKTFLVSYHLPLSTMEDKELVKAKEDVEKLKKKHTPTSTPEENKKLEDAKEALRTIYAKYVTNFVAKNDKDVKAFNDAMVAKKPFSEIEPLFKAAFEAENKFREEEKQKSIEEGKKNAFQYIKTYFTTFAGKLNASKIKMQEISPLMLDLKGQIQENVKAYDFVDNFKINLQDEEDIKKAVEELLLKKPNDYVTPTIAFVVGYTVEIETM